MSQRHTTVPSTRESSRSPRSDRKGRIARDKNEKQSARRRPALDNRFHRTDLRFTRTNRDALTYSSRDAATQRFVRVQPRVRWLVADGEWG
jgi:hypothetical protein